MHPRRDRLEAELAATAASLPAHPARAWPDPGGRPVPRSRPAGGPGKPPTLTALSELAAALARHSVSVAHRGGMAGSAATAHEMLATSCRT
jgi:hypothetical protein